MLFRSSGGRQVLLGSREVAVSELLEQLLAQWVNRRLASRAVHRDVKAHVLVEEQVKVGVEENRVAAMSDDVQSVPVLVIEAQRHRRQGGIEMVRGRMHQLGCRRIKQ